MKKAFTILAAFALVISIASCKKCIECTYTYDGTAYTSGEQCGSSREVNSIQDEWEKSATALGTIATCEDK